MTRQVALLRGVNLGNRQRVAMADLRGLLSRLGYADVRTHSQSGNVVLTSELAPGRLGRELEQQLEDGLGLRTQVLVRTRDELADVIGRDPLAGVADNPSRYQVSFLSAEPEAGVVRGLESLIVPPEQLVWSGREIYAWHPNGIHDSRLAKALVGSKLGVAATARNWNTVRKLLALADD